MDRPARPQSPKTRTLPRRLASACALALLAACSPEPSASAVAPPGEPPAGPAPVPAPVPGLPAATWRAARDPAFPPPISGGTLAVSRDGTVAVAADADRDRLSIVDLPGRRLAHEIPLHPGDEPGRVVEDAAGRFHVVLRGGAALLDFTATGEVLSRRAVCPAPRGLAADGDRVHVACTDGALVTLPAAGGAELRRLRVADDLRDVVVQGGRLYVSRFRAAELIEVASDGAMAWRGTPLPVMLENSPSEPDVAWRTVAMPSGGVLMAHQRCRTRRPLPTTQGGYRPSNPTGCSTVGIVQASVTYLAPPLPPLPSPLIPQAVLPVDLAVSADGSRLLLVAAGNAAGQVLTASTNLVTSSATCLPQFQPVPGGPTRDAVAAAFTPDGNMVVQLRQPAALSILPGGVVIPLNGADRTDAGHELFHKATPSLIACASCHPEGGDDGRVWSFDKIGARRTQHLRGGLVGTEPFHWDGDMTGMAHLLTDVFVGRMGGQSVTGGGDATLLRWLDAQPALPVTWREDAAAVARGERLFHDAQVACASCHRGPHLTSAETVDVGTGGRFQVPSLIGVAARAPYLHGGAAATLRDRFGGSGGGDAHGKISGLLPAEIDDLTAYLETL